LYVKGNRSLIKDGVAIVGSRKASPLGLKQAFNLGYECAKRDIPVISGGALGCDIKAHEGVLATNDTAQAVVVQAGGLERLTPKTNTTVFYKIVEQEGALVSERGIYHIPIPVDFLRRNRIIAGLCHTLFLIESEEKSGAKVTAKLALEYGREILVLDHLKNEHQNLGNKMLMDEGAISFQDYKEIFER